MDAFHQFTLYLTEYGYLAIFALVFLQQIGVPNPLTNELVLIFCGYLSYSGTLNIYKAIAAAVVADGIGSLIIFFVFYFFSKWLIAHSPKWLPLTGDKIERMKQRVLSRGQRGIFILRLMPVIRGYASVVAGMLEIDPKAFIGNVIATAVVWNAGLVIIGRLIGPYWSQVVSKSGVIGNIVLVVLLLTGIILIGRYFQKKELTQDK